MPDLATMLAASNYKRGFFTIKTSTETHGISDKLTRRHVFLKDTSSIMITQPPGNRSYSFLFSETLARRMRYVNKIYFLVALLASILLKFPYGGFWWNLVDSLYRVPLLFLAALLVKRRRINDSTVEYSQAKSLFKHTVGRVFDRSFCTSLLHNLIASHIIFGLELSQIPLFSKYYIIAKELRVKSAVNDTWVFFWFHAFFCALIYSIQHVVFQRNRLQIPYGISTVKPETVLFSKWGYLIGTSIFFTGFTTVVSPIVYFFTRSIIYGINWPILAVLSLDTSMPYLHIGLADICNVAFASLVLFLFLETVNHTYNTYATIGCLDGKTAISSRSSDPIATLLSGLRLRDTEQKSGLARATAFQELAYIASTNDDFCLKARKDIYNAHPKGVSWSALFDECAFIIRGTSARINFRSSPDIEALQTLDTNPAEARLNTSKNDLFIFGNSHDTTFNDTTQFAVSATSSPLKKRDTFFPAVKITRTSTICNKLVAVLWNPLSRAFDSFYRPLVSHQKQHIKAETAIWKALFLGLYDQFFDSGAGALFRPSLKRDTESRTLNASLYGNAVIALSRLTSYAVEEDRSNTVTNAHVSEVLNTLERPIRSCSNYTDYLPASVYLTPTQKHDVSLTKQQLVAEIHDLTMTEFYHLCVKYSYRLNDLSLSLRAFDLAKWVTDVSVAEQKNEEKSQMAKLL